MLCSISTRKSGSNWLDRLRSAKGFPVDSGCDLEHFLHPNPNTAISEISGDIPADDPSEKKIDLASIVDQPCHDRKKRSANSDLTATITAKNEDWFEIMSSVLAKLFNMGDPQRVGDFDEKKSCRKQLNPKICVLAESASFNGSCFAGAQRSDGVLALSPSSVENSVTEMKESDGGLMVPGKHRGSSVDFEEEAIDSDLSSYSRAEVTVIDTSSVNWKSEKAIFRKGNVWKIRDKKRRSSCIKKRKLGEFDRLVGDKVEQLSSLPPLHACKEADCNQGLHYSKEGGTHNNKRESLKKTSDDLSQNPERRPLFSRSPRKPANRDSSVFQSITTITKNGAHCPKSCLKDTR